MIPCDHALNKVFSVHRLIRAAVNIRVESFADFLHSYSQFFALIKKINRRPKKYMMPIFLHLVKFKITIIQKTKLL